ncbi:MAG: zinc-dependent metalloprotease [Verrucomicrobiaceae bacterium]|nr:zinc-dependent metalloprotease [Verrucomicrobiaceae bacterium]
MKTPTYLLAVLGLTLATARADTQPAATVSADPVPSLPPGIVVRTSTGMSIPGMDYPKPEDVIKDYAPVVSTVESQGSFYKLWKRDKDQQLLAELPRNFMNERHFVALTVSGGENYAGLQAGELYAYWAVYDKKLALIEPNLEVRSTGDDQSKSSIKRLFTDRVILETPIVAWNKQQGAGPMIDLDSIVVGQADKFFGRLASGLNKSLYKLKIVKAFPQNIEIGIEAPVGSGQLKTFHFSFSLIPDKTGYNPREADTRVGYFTTSYNDYGKFVADQTRTRFINRWHLEKADPSLKLSPPKTPIIFYVEHTTPVRYRRWVKEGIQLWNKAFEKVGLINTIEVRFQDAATGEHMEKDPEDVRYNFVRWLSNGQGTAIGPSRVHPLTGQILDADIILTDGWIRHWWSEYNETIPQALAMEGMTPETLSWLWKNPQWDPRVRLASASKREEIIAARKASPMPHLGGHAMAGAPEEKGFMGGGHEADGLMARYSQKTGLCMAPSCKTHGLALMEMSLDAEGFEAMGLSAADQTLDGIPESFIGPLLVDLVAHEVGHTLGLRHNFKSSSAYTYAQINSPDFKGKKPLAGSVMDYIPINIVAGADPAKKGDFGMITVGPYDEWAIEYGYSFEKDLKPVLQRVAEPELAYATDEDTWGPDPLARRYDFAKDPISFAENQIALVKEHRSKLLDKFVKDGNSWAKARRGYRMTLSTQTRAINMMSNWLGGTFVNRDKKGDKNGRAPVQPVPVADQRRALQFCLDQSFNDAAFGLEPKLLAYLTTDKWWDDEDQMEDLFDDGTWNVHDSVLGIQAMTLTSIMNPTTLSRVYDNEMRVPVDQDALTLPEVLNTVGDKVWTELGNYKDGQQFTARKPFITSLRRNLQREHLDRLIDLVTSSDWARYSPAYAPITDLATQQLAGLQAKINAVAAKPMDAYTQAHLQAAARRIKAALEAQVELR